METVLRTGETLGADLALKNVFVRILEALTETFADTALSILIYDDNERTLRFVPETLKFYPIDNPEFSTRHVFPIEGPSIACKVARRALNGVPNAYELIEVVGRNPDYLPLISESSAELCVSLVSQEKLLGVLVLERQAPHRFDEYDVKLVQGVAHQIALAMQRAEESSNLKFKSNVAAAYAWTADIAHDINRELGHLKILADLIQKSAHQPEEVKTYAHIIESSVRQLSNLNPQRADADWVIIDEEVRNLVSEFSHASNIETNFHLNCKTLQVKLNRFAFRRVWRHLVRNAAQAMSEFTAKHLLIQTRRVDNEYIAIKITDSGPGVSEEAAPFIFQDRVTTKNEEGGYGLLMVRQMIEDMDGSIRWLPSPKQSGATFAIRLPIQPVDNEPLEEYKDFLHHLHTGER